MNLQEKNQKIEAAVVGGYQKVEESVVGGYKRMEESVVSRYKEIEDKFVGKFLTRKGETTEEAKARLQKEVEKR